MNKKKIKKIKENAQELTLEQNEQATKETEDLLLKLNTEIENRIDQFRSDSIRILRDVHQTRPFQIFSVINEQTDRIYQLVNNISKTLDPIIDNFFRRATSDCIKDIVDILTK